MKFKTCLITILLSNFSLLTSQNALAIESVSEGAPSELSRSSVVVRSHPEFRQQNHQQFSWAIDHAEISGNLQKSGIPVKQLLDNAISHALQSKGYRYIQKADDVLLIQYHVSLESEMDDTALAIRYGLAPGLHANHVNTQKYERGTLVVDLINPGMNKVIWRGAIGVFTGVEETDKGRQKRVRELMVELFSSLPIIKR